MSLKSGLLAESTWALNALTVLLHDEQTLNQVSLPQLPGLLDAVVDHFRLVTCYYLLLCLLNCAVNVLALTYRIQ